MTDVEFTGVWLALNDPADENEGATSSEAILEVLLDLTPVEMDFYEVKEEGKTYREFLIPAELLNLRAKVRPSR